jgi:hypothetical protein
MRMARIEHAWSPGFRRYIINASSAAGAEVRRVFEVDFDQRGLRRLGTTRAADAGGPIEDRTEPRGQGSRSQRAALVSRVREEGASGRFDQVAETQGS